jgi:hypothetical protein
MIDALFSFFSSFNPMMFALILSLGAVILMRRPASYDRVQVLSTRTQIVRTLLRRQS